MQTNRHQGLPFSIKNSRRNYRARYWTQWHTAATALGLASFAAITAALIKLNTH